MSTTCVTMWIGGSLGPIERACLRSMARQGHSVALYCYRDVAGVPDEVEVRDAAAIIPFSEISAPRFARPDLFSDWFRYELLRRSLGTWVDVDVYMLKPFDPARPYLFGTEAPAVFNNAVLRMPPDSPLLPGLLEPFYDPRTPRWLPWRRYLPLKAREILTGQCDLTRTAWGTTGPQALTTVVHALGMADLAEPQERFYPVHWTRAAWIRDPQIALEDVVAEDTVAVHLWNHCISAFKDDPAARGSFLNRLQEEGR